MPDAIISGLQPPTTLPYSYQPAAVPGREPGRFGRIFGGILGGALNVVAPGVGSIVGGILRGGNLPGLADAEVMLAQQYHQQMQLFSIQNRVNSLSQQFQMLSNLMKARHDSEMAAIQNLK